MGTDAYSKLNQDAHAARNLHDAAHLFLAAISSPRARRSPPPAWRPSARAQGAALPPGRPELHHGRGRSLRTGHAPEAIKIGVDEVNGRRRGRRQFQLYAEDDQTKPDAAVLAVKKLIEINKVEAVIGIWPSSVGLAAMPITNAAGLITEPAARRKC